MIPVYEDNKIIARVKYNSNLDYWGGNNWTCGSTGLHKGLTQLKKSKKYVLIFRTQWQGEKDYVEIISAEEAVQEILKSGNVDLFDNFPELKELVNVLDSDE